jgi:alkylated DNA repair dioxygenase AlkB
LNIWPSSVSAVPVCIIIQRNPLTLITEYPSGAGIGWHRDAPVFGIVAAVSLAGAGRLRFQRGEAGERQTAEIILAPRSAYVLAGPARSEWRHGIPSGSELRYSVTFRTLRRRGG